MNYLKEVVTTGKKVTPIVKKRWPIVRDALDLYKGYSTTGDVQGAMMNYVRKTVVRTVNEHWDSLGLVAMAEKKGEVIKELVKHGGGYLHGKMLSSASIEPSRGPRVKRSRGGVYAESLGYTRRKRPRRKPQIPEERHFEL